MNTKGELTIQSMLNGILIVGLIFGIFGAIILSLEPNYDTTEIDKEDLSRYNTMTDLVGDIDTATADIDKVTPDPNAFDFFSDIWSKITTPFKFIYRSITTFKNIAVSVVDDLNLFDIIGDYLVTLITVTIIIGIVMIKFYMGRNK